MQENFLGLINNALNNTHCHNTHFNSLGNRTGTGSRQVLQHGHHHHPGKQIGMAEFKVPNDQSCKNT